MNAAGSTDQANPLRPIYWSALDLQREVARLRAEYARQYKHLKTVCLTRWPKVRR